jgi:thiamine transporter ThiT
MLKRLAITTQPMPLSLKLTNIKTYGIIIAFVVLSVLTPWIFHQYPNAGPTYLPMHLFVFIAALTCGWQTGVIVGLLTPFASYLVSGMPAMTVLPQIAVEITVYGFLAGLLRQKLHLHVIWSLLGAMIGGRLALLIAVVIVQAITGSVYSPLGPSATPGDAVWNTITQAWPGMLIQLAVIPLAFLIYERIKAKKQTEQA